jgi:hypothetical protein
MYVGLYGMVCMYVMYVFMWCMYGMYVGIVDVLVYRMVWEGSSYAASGPTYPRGSSAPVCMYTYLPTYLPTYLLTQGASVPTYLPTYSSYLCTYLPHLFTYLPTYPRIHLPTYLPAYIDKSQWNVYFPSFALLIITSLGLPLCWIVYVRPMASPW